MLKLLCCTTQTDELEFTKLQMTQAKMKQREVMHALAMHWLMGEIYIGNITKN